MESFWTAFPTFLFGDALTTGLDLTTFNLLCACSLAVGIVSGSFLKTPVCPRPRFTSNHPEKPMSTSPSPTPTANCSKATPFQEELPRLVGSGLLECFGLSHVQGQTAAGHPLLFNHNVVPPLLLPAIPEDTESCGWAVQPKASAKVGVGFLALAALPACWPRLLAWQPDGGATLLRRIGLVLLLLWVGILLNAPLSAADGLRLRGHLTDELLNGEGTPHPGTKRFVWEVELSSVGTWQLRSTNLANPGWRSVVTFDGTNTYIVQPSVSDSSTPARMSPDPALDLATVSTGPLPLLPADDHGRLTALWTCFCAREATRLAGQEDPSVPWPVLGWYPRSNLKAWGFRWVFVEGETPALSEGRFASGIRMLRETALDDSSFEKAILRPDFLFPMDPETRRLNEGQWLALQTYTNGMVGAEFNVLSWRGSGPDRIPETAQLSYWGPGARPHLYQRLSLTLVSAESAALAAHVPPHMVVKTWVDDYRYQEKGPRKQYPAASYHGMPGDRWRSDEDPELIRQQAAFREAGPKYPFTTFNRTHALLLLGLVPILVVLRKLWGRRNSPFTNSSRIRP